MLLILRVQKVGETILNSILPKVSKVIVALTLLQIVETLAFIINRNVFIQLTFNLNTFSNRRLK